MRIIKEEKQVGVIYHFTDLYGILNIIKSNGLRSKSNNYISFTRNFDLTKLQLFFKDIPIKISMSGFKPVRL